MRNLVVITALVLLTVVCSTSSAQVDALYVGGCDYLTCSDTCAVMSRSLYLTPDTLWYSWFTDQDTKMWRPNANEIALTVGNETMALFSNSIVGNNLLTLTPDSTQSDSLFTLGGIGSGYDLTFRPSGTVDWYVGVTGPSSRLRFDSTDQVLIQGSKFTSTGKLGFPGVGTCAAEDINMHLSGDTDTGVSLQVGEVRMCVGGVEGLRVNTAVSSVNRVEVTPAATGIGPTIGVAGDDTNINLNLTAKGTGSVKFTEKRSLNWGAGSMEVDGTECANQVAVELVSGGPKPQTIACNKDDLAVIRGSGTMPQDWDGGTVTFTLMLGQILASTDTFEMDFEGQCVGSGESYLPFVGTNEQPVTITLTEDDDSLSATTPAVTLNGSTCAAGDDFQWQGAVDSTGSTESAGPLETLVVVVEVIVGYQANVGSD